MNNRCKGILFRIILVVSSVDCWIMFTWSKKVFIICAVMGVLTGIILCHIHFRLLQSGSKIEILIGFMVSLLFCFNLAVIFYHTWITSQIAEKIANLLSLNAVVFMKFLSCVLALIAFPSVVYTIQWLVYCWKLIDIRKVWKMLVSSFSVKSLLGIIVNVGGASILGTLLLIGVYCLPVAPIENHVNSSAEVFEAEGSYPSLFSWCTSRLDNYTDALMLLEAADDTDDSVTNKAMLIYHGTISEFHPSKVLVAHYINGTGYDRIATYPRYWHGYQILLKVLLEFMDYQSIRILNAIFQLLLVVIVLRLLLLRNMKEYVTPYLLSYLMLMPVTLAKSLQYSTCYYIFTFSMIFLLLPKEKMKSQYIYFVFLNTGIATAFFDFLTYPIATFGIPALLYLFMHSDNQLEQRLFNLLKSLFSWGAGYVGMWSLKWVKASLITGNNVILDALNRILLRASNTDANSTHYMVIECEIKNMITFLTTPFTFLVVMFIVLIVVQLIRKKHLTYYEAYKQLIPYIVVGFMPFMWYALATNHSAVHTWFTNKACVVSVLAIMCGVVELNGLISKKQI